MLVALADTHAAVWYLAADTRLSKAAEELIIKAQQTGDQVGVSTISLIEIIYLVEKGRIPRESFINLFGALANPRNVLTEIPVDHRAAWVMGNIPREDIPDMPDRIIAATALHLGVPLISRDSKIKLSKVKTIW